MKKFILILVLLILTLSFAVFFYNVYVQQKDYFKKERDITPPEEQIVYNDSIAPSLYLAYSKEEYDKALDNHRPVVLFFLANWCIECGSQDVLNSELFKELTTEGVIGFKIHILDSETTTETDSLAKKFDVTKENTFVVLNKTGAVSFKHVGEIEKSLLKVKILEAR